MCRVLKRYDLEVGWDQPKNTVVFHRKRLWFCESVTAGGTGRKSTGSTFKRNSLSGHNGASSATGQHFVPGNISS